MTERFPWSGRAHSVLLPGVLFALTSGSVSVYRAPLYLGRCSPKSDQGPDQPGRQAVFLPAHTPHVQGAGTTLSAQTWAAQGLNSKPGFFFFKKRFYLFIFREGKGGSKRERNIHVWLPLVCPLLGTWPITQTCILSENRTGDPLVRRLALSPQSHTSQDCKARIFH